MLATKPAGILLAAGVLLGMLAGCASPGPPLPPSLKLPEVVTDLAASRAGDAVTLRWMTPSRTTDKLLIAGPVTAVICRDSAAVPLAGAGKNARKGVASGPCTAMVREQVTPGESEVVDTLPESLTSVPALVLEYRVQLLNAAGRTAGPSRAAFVAGGPAPPVVAEFRGTATKRGVMLEWRAENAGGPEVVELDRIAVGAPAAASGQKAGFPGAAKEPEESRFRAGGAGSADAASGGTADRTAQLGHTYRYKAQRVQSVLVSGQTLEVRSVPSAEVTVAMRDVFPPEMPVGLVAVPGFGSEGENPKPAIDLSWDPNMEPRLAGYRIYRRDLDGDGSWRLLGGELVRMAAYRDAAVAAGKRYAYRVTAVNEAGNESGPSGDVTETAPEQ